jgi:hypothetical protein
MASSGLQEMWLHSGTEVRPPHGDELSRSEILDQLERIVISSHFCHSKRYPSFLRFVVEQTLSGHVDVLKERTLGTAVFGRASDYDTNADPIVRVTAGEIRKRLAQYYQTPGHEYELRVDLPLGSYIPHFSAPALVPLVEGPAASAEPVEVAPEVHVAEALVLPVPTRVNGGRRRRWLMTGLMGAAVAAVILFVALGQRGRFTDPGTYFIWHSILASPNPAVVVVGVHSIDNHGKNLPTDAAASSSDKEPQNMMSMMVHYDLIPVSDVASYSKLTDLLTQHGHPHQTRSSRVATLEDLRRGPVILLGGLDNVWTMRLTAPLRYRFLATTELLNGIEDRQNPANRWMFDNGLPAHGNGRDYAIVASYFDTTIEQHVLIIAGVGKSGTVAASEFVTSRQHLEAWFKQARLSPEQNVELVLSTDILDGEPGPPHVVASYTW